MYLLYELLHGAALVLAAPYLFYRSATEPGYWTSLRARFGSEAPPADARPSIWIHAVSVGEVIAASVLVPALRAAFPEHRLVVSVTTVTGRRVADDKLAEADAIFFCPIDLRLVVRRFVRRLAPEALLVVETELWPNLFREARRAGAAVLVVNGRISDASFPRYRWVRGLLKTYLREVDRYLMQNDLYAQRVLELGAPSERVEVAGSLKFDAVPRGAAPRSRMLPEGRTVLMAGSTLEPEEAILLEAFGRLRERRRDLVLVLAPRHVPRFDAVVELARSKGFRVRRRSEGPKALAAAEVVVLDTLGELAALYGEADIVFVGGSLATWGGHNIIEPALHGKPVLFGPHMQNFPDVARLFVDAGAAIQVASAEELESRIGELLDAPEKGRALAASAERVIATHRGATERVVSSLESLLS